jgi:hypothetical protein
MAAFGRTHHLPFRFVDRDMFMRYRGGGIGHKYMRAIEETYENMSRERIHHKGRKRGGARSQKDTPMDVDNADNDDSEGEGEPVGSQADQGTRPGGSTSAVDTNAWRILAGDVTDGDDDDDDDDYAPDSDLCSSGISDSDDLDSDENCGGYESYGLGDF